MLKYPKPIQKNGKINIVLICIFSVSILIQMTVMLATLWGTASIFDLNTNSPGSMGVLIISIIPSILISWLTSVLTVRLYLKKDLLQYSNNDISKNSKYSCLITIFLGVVGTAIIISGGDVDVFTNSFVGGWVIFILLLLSFGILLFCVIAATILYFGTTSYMGNMKNSRQ